MRRRLATWLGAGLLGLTAGCSRQAPAEERSPGELAFRARCQTCHRLPRATDKTDEQWRVFLKGHGAKAGLSDAASDSILIYLTR